MGYFCHPTTTTTPSTRKRHSIAVLSARLRWAIAKPSLHSTISDSRDVIDSLFILQHTVGSRAASAECPPPTNALYLPLCDTNNDNACNVIDALFIIQCGVGNNNVLCPAENGATDAPSRAIAATSSIVVGSGYVSSGSSVMIPISLSVPDNAGFAAATMDITYDAAILTGVGCETNSELLGSCNFTQNAAGDEIVRFSVASESARAGTFQMVEINFASVDGVQSGSSQLVAAVELFVDEQGNSLPYSAQNGTIELSSTPTNVALGRSAISDSPYGLLGLISVLLVAALTLALIQHRRA